MMAVKGYAKDRTMKGALTREGMQKIGPERAKEMLERMVYADRRRVSKTQVAQIARHMREGNFIEGKQIDVCVDRTTEHEWFVNGQHRLCAVIDSECEVTFDVRVHEVASLEDVNRIYAVIDR